MDGPTTLGSVGLVGNVGALSGVLLSAGTHGITAVYSGDGSYQASTSTTLAQLVTSIASTTTLLATPSSVTRRGTTQLTVTTTAPGVSVPAGTTVTVVSAGGTAGVTAGQVIGTAVTDALGVATVSYTAPNRAGTLLMRAAYPGSNGIRASTSATVLVAVR